MPLQIIAIPKCKMYKQNYCIVSHAHFSRANKFINKGEKTKERHFVAGSKIIKRKSFTKNRKKKKPYQKKKMYLAFISIPTMRKTEHNTQSTSG